MNLFGSKFMKTTLTLEILGRASVWLSSLASSSQGGAKEGQDRLQLLRGTVNRLPKTQLVFAAKIRW